MRDDDCASKALGPQRPLRRRNIRRVLADWNVDIDLIVPDDRPLCTAILLKVDKAAIGEFSDVISHFRRVTVNGPGEFTNALRLMVRDFLEQFKVRRPEDPAERLEVRNGERRRLRVDTLIGIESCKRVLGVAAVGRRIDSDMECLVMAWDRVRSVTNRFACRTEAPTLSMIQYL